MMVPSQSIIAKTFALGIVAAALSSTSVAEANDVSQVYDRVVETADGRELDYVLQLPVERSEGIPLLVVVDGSGCVGHKRPGFSQLLSPQEHQGSAFARLVVGKTGVPAEKATNEDCSEEFLRHYAIDDRVIDHLRVLQVATRNADWWNGEVYVFGWSDGGDIAAQLFAFNPSIGKLAFGGVGGGLTMNQHFEDFWVCAEELTLDRENCLTDLRRQLAAMIKYPTWQEQWSGQSNSFKAWESRLSTRLTPLLLGEHRPILMVHGSRDFAGAPVESARVLALDIQGDQTPAFEYWEIEGMGHTFSSLPRNEAGDLEARVLSWLLNSE